MSHTPAHSRRRPATVSHLATRREGGRGRSALRTTYEDAAPAAMIGASNHFEVAIATATMLFGLSSGAALATVVGVLIEVPVMLLLVRFCLRTEHWFTHAAAQAAPAGQPVGQGPRRIKNVPLQ